MSTFAERLREERKRLGLNQTLFGVQGGVTKETQLNYENGTRTPDAKYLAKAADFGLDVLYVITGKRTPKAPEAVVWVEDDEQDVHGRPVVHLSPAQQQLLAHYDAAEPPTQRLIEALIEVAVRPDLRPAAPRPARKRKT